MGANDKVGATFHPQPKTTRFTGGTMKLEAIERPNGKMYRPRAIRVQVMGAEDEAPDAIAVLGTRDSSLAIEAARVEVSEYMRLWYDGDYALNITDDAPIPVWYTRGLTSWNSIDGPRFHFTNDPVKGAAGLLFRLEEVEVPRDTEPSVSGSEFAPGECDGSSACTATKHVHGCYTPHRSTECDAPNDFGHIPEPGGSR
jgi:hypothetical protein